MSSIFELKEQSVTETPLLLFDCVLVDGRVERWSTHHVTVENATYEARVLQHSLFEIQASSEQGVDGIPRISVVLANPDSRFSEIERDCGWKGAHLTVSFLFYNLREDEPATDRTVMFQGVCNPPEEIREATFRISARNRLNLQRLLMPQVRIQRRCPWNFPATQAQRLEGMQGGSNGKYSRYFRCGYSADLPGGCGTMNGDSPYMACGYTRSECEARGMFHRFGGFEFVPSAVAVRTYGDKNWHQSSIVVNQARYNDFVPLLYGTSWYTPPVVFARNDGNLTRMEVLLGQGEIQGVLKVLVNEVEIPLGVAGANMTGTGWYNVSTLGTRDGTRNPDFTNGQGEPAGDPYGSMAYLATALPNRLNDGTSLPRIRVLVQGLKLPVYDQNGAFTGEQFSANPAWIALDILRRSGWSESEIDLLSFARVAELCEEDISAQDIYGNPITLPRFSCNLALQNRRSAGDLLRGVRNSARLLLSYGANGALQLRMENSLSVEAPIKQEWSNSRDALDGGWPSYEFGDGTNSTSGILRTSSGEPSLRLFCRSLADTPNRLTVEFQDALNEFQQDSFSLVDTDDVERSGQEIAAPLSALGLPHFDQAARILKLALDKSLRGNTYVEFDTSVKCLGVRPGDLIALTYLKEGFVRQLFRVLKLAPGANHRVTTITAQFHDDSWYDDSNGQLSSTSGGRRERNAGMGIPHPLVGSRLNGDGSVDFGVEEIQAAGADGTAESTVAVSFIPPAAMTASGPPIPLISLAASVDEGGSIPAGQIFYYAISASDELGNESGLSFIVRATTIENCRITLTGLSFGPGTSTFTVYRGRSPAQMFRIASAQPASQFIDSGLPNQLMAAPDPNFDHGNFYWRMELQPEYAASMHSPTSVGNSELEMPANRYRGMIARITAGTGAGQERRVVANTATTLEVAPNWDISPGGDSFFVVAENGWRFGTIVRTSPAILTIPNRSGETVHLTGRAANTNDLESPDDLATVTRWQMGGTGTYDQGPPSKPYFGLGTLQRGGGVELTGVSFADLKNTHSISAATVILHFWDELQGLPDVILASDVDTESTEIELSHAIGGAPGDFVRVDQEIMQVVAVLGGGLSCRVARGVHSSPAAAHTTGERVYLLKTATAIAPFPPGFFGSPYGGSWSHPISLPNVKVASAELFVTNSRGNSPVASLHLTNNDDRGMRTFGGGQYSIQVSGCLAIVDAAAPPLIVESARSVREISAVLGTPADTDVNLRLNLDDDEYCTLAIPNGMTLSYAVDGNGLPPLRASSRLTLSVVSVGVVNPGADLTVTIRL